MIKLMLVCLLVLTPFTLVLIFFSEFLAGSEHCRNYIQHYKNMKSLLINRWQKHYEKLLHGIVACSIVGCPFLLEFIVFNSISILKLVFVLSWSFVIYSIRYGWLMLLIVSIEWLIESNHFPKYTQQYSSIKQKAHPWQADNNFRQGILIFFILTSPFLLEMFLFNCLWIIYSIIITIIRHTLMIVMGF